MCVRNKFACIVFRKHRRSLNVENGGKEKNNQKFIFGTELHCIAVRLVRANGQKLMQDDIGLI